MDFLYNVSDVIENFTAEQFYLITVKVITYICFLIAGITISRCYRYKYDNVMISLFNALFLYIVLIYCIAIFLDYLFYVTFLSYVLIISYVSLTSYRKGKKEREQDEKYLNFLSEDYRRKKR